MNSKREYENCYIVFSDVCQTKANYIAARIMEEFSLNCKVITYPIRKNEEMNKLDNYLQNDCILILGDLDLFSEQNCNKLENFYKLGLAHGRDRPVILINFTENIELNQNNIPPYIKYDFIIYSPPVVPEKVIIQIHQILSSIIRESRPEILYHKAVEIHEQLKKQSTFFIEKLDREDFAKALNPKTLTRYFDLYLNNKSEDLKFFLTNIVVKIYKTYSTSQSNINIVNVPGDMKEEFLMSDRQRLADLKEQLDLLYEKLGTYEKELIINSDLDIQFKLKQRIKREILPQMRKYEREYWELYPQEDIVISEQEAETQLAQVEQAVESIQQISSTEYPPELIPLLQDIQVKLEDLNKPASAKLKVALPLIPAIAAYELEMETDGLMYKAWKSIKGVFRR